MTHHRFSDKVLVSNQTATAKRLPSEIKLELLASHHQVMPQLEEVVRSVGVPEGADREAWLAERLSQHAAGQLMIFGARVGRYLAGFMVLEPATMSASYSWVSERYRHKGLGERFYSFACINLAVPTPVFVYPSDMDEEYKSLVKTLEIKPRVEEAFYTLNDAAKAGLKSATPRGVPPAA